MHRTVKIEVFYPYPPQQIWQVLTNRQALAGWLMDNDFEPRVGHQFKFWMHSLPGLEGIIHCQVLALDEHKRLAYTWRDNLMQYPSIVTWTLTPVNGGTRLELEHQGIKSEVIALGKFQRSTPNWQSQSMYELIEITQTLPVGKYEVLDSVILNSFLNGKWDYSLNERLPQVLLSLTANNE